MNFLVLARLHGIRDSDRNTSRRNFKGYFLLTKLDGIRDSDSNTNGRNFEVLERLYGMKDSDSNTNRRDFMEVLARLHGIKDSDSNTNRRDFMNCAMGCKYKILRIIFVSLLLIVLDLLLGCILFLDKSNL